MLTSGPLNREHSELIKVAKCKVISCKSSHVSHILLQSELSSIIIIYNG